MQAWRKYRTFQVTRSRRKCIECGILVYLHVLNVIGAISCLSRNKSTRSELEVAEERLFWKALGEISLLHADVDDATSIEYQLNEKNPALGAVLLSFPDKAKTTDGRMWLPLHFALSLQTIDLEITQALLTAQPQRIHTPIAANLSWLEYESTINIDPDDEDYISATSEINPCHLAFMRKEQCPGVIDQLYACDANFASSRASDGSFPLHVAVRYSNSVDLIRRLVDQYPDALNTKNKSGETPLFALRSNINPAAPEILKFFLQAAPETLRMGNNIGNLPLHEFAIRYDYTSDSVDQLTVPILLDAYPEAAGIVNNVGELPLHIAAKYACTEVFQIIVENTSPDNLMDVGECGSVSHYAVKDCSLEKLKHLHSVKPELLLYQVRGKTPLHEAIDNFGRSGDSNCAFIKAVASLAPEALTMLDNAGNNLLHALVSNLSIRKNVTIEEIMRFLLRSIPGGAIVINNNGQTPFDVLTKTLEYIKDILASNYKSVLIREANELQIFDYISVLRRLLLLAGAPSLHPELRNEMNYGARKDALFAFFAERKLNQNSSSSCRSCRPDVFSRIRNGPGSLELMKQIVSFL